MIDHSGKILILTGAPGSGKTTTARLLTARDGSPKVHLHADDFWHFIKNGAIPPYLPEAHAQNAIIMEILAKVADGYARGGYFVVLDGIVGPWFLIPFRSLTVPVHYIVLSAPLDAVIERCRARREEGLADPAAIATLHSQFSSLDRLEQHALATGDESPEQLAALVIEALDSGAYRLHHAND